jgi:hypothetical protein
MDKPLFDKMQMQTLAGDALGVQLMHTAALIEAAGPQWLTEAFHAAGTLPKDNAVVAIHKMVCVQSLAPSSLSWTQLLVVGHGAALG